MKKETKTNRIALTGGAASAEALRQIEPEVMSVYPITPQTPIIETFAKFKADGEVVTEMIEAESEHSAISACVGASAAGARTVTATSSQGLALMNEILYITSGMRLPVMMLVSARALSAPLNIHGDHSDVMGARDTGWVQIFCEDAQEVYDSTIIGMKLAEAASVPVMVIMDGFHTSHTVENLEILPDAVVKKFVGTYQAKNSLLDHENPVTYGSLALQTDYFEFKIDQAKAMQDVMPAYQKAAYDFEKISRRYYDYFESYQAVDAECLIVLMGSTAGTAKDVVDKLRAQGKKVGLVKVKLFRPFPHQEFDVFLSQAKRVAVLDRAMSIGTMPPLFQEITTAVHLTENNNPELASYVYGLGGRDTFGADIEKVFEDLIAGNTSKETRYINAKVE